MSAVGGMAVERTDEADEIRISWDALKESAFYIYKARLIVIVEGGGDDRPRYVALGDTGLVVDEVELARELAISVVITLGDYVLSDIAEAEYTSGLPAPTFVTDLVAKHNPTDEVPVLGQISDGKDYGDFYYLGFNDLFDNGYPAKAAGGKTLVALNDQPESPKFKVGLRYGDEDIDPSDADFKH